MKTLLLFWHEPLGEWVVEVRDRIGKTIVRYWFRAALLSVLGYGMYAKTFSVNVQMDGMVNSSISTAGVSSVGLAQPTSLAVTPVAEKPMNVSLIEPSTSTTTKTATQPDLPTKANDNLANHFSNVSFPDEDGHFEPLDRRAAKRKKQLAYVKQFVRVAQLERDRFGIPASITLGQGLLESDAGGSPLSTTANNHFGIKCFSRSCRRGHCKNFTDDSHKDFFRVYASDWESFRAHSQLLQAGRYRRLYKLGKKDYTSWALGLSKAGYATDKKYAQKLIHLIEDLDLHQYD
jgi:flagellum-specific peptidoglycan hydrolase FlgJ